MKFAMKTAMVMGMLAGSISFANANSGKVTFEGSIHDGACSISGDSVEQNVNLGAISKQDIVNGGRTKGEQFTISLEGCDLAAFTNKTVTTTFTGVESTSVPGALAISGDAKGVGIVIESGETPIELGEETAPQTISDGNNDLVFNTYVKGALSTGIPEVSPIVSGEFTSVVNFTLAYQ